MWGLHQMWFNDEDITEKLNAWILNDFYDFIVGQWIKKAKREGETEIFSAYDPYGEENWNEN